MTKGMSVVVVSLALATLGGCKNKCVTLEERVCSDLGAADCALWRERGGAEAMLPSTRRGSATCGALLDQYPQVLEGQKQVVLAFKAGDAAVKAATPAAK